MTKKNKRANLDIETPKGIVSHKIIQLSSKVSYKTDIKPESRKLRQYSGHITRKDGRDYLHIEDKKSMIIQETILPKDYPKLIFHDNNDTYFAPSDVSSDSGTTAFAGIPKKVIEHKKVNDLDDCGIKQDITPDGNWRKYTNISGTSMVIYPIYIKQNEDGFELDLERIKKVHHKKDHAKY